MRVVDIYFGAVGESRSCVQDPFVRVTDLTLAAREGFKRRSHDLGFGKVEEPRVEPQEWGRLEAVREALSVVDRASDLSPVPGEEYFLE